MDATDDIPDHLIHCADDGLVPWAIVCRHLLDGLSREWIPVPVEDGRPVANDRLCPACYRGHYLGYDRAKDPAAAAADLATVCVHCVGEMLAERAGTVARI